MDKDRTYQAIKRSWDVVGEVVTPSEPSLPSISGIVATYNAGEGITLTVADVTGWADQSGNGNNLTSSTPPLFVASDSGFNDKPVVEFDGVSEHIEILDFHVSALTTNTVVLCAQLLATTAEKNIYSSGNHVSNRQYFGTGTSTWRLWSGAAREGGTSDTNVHVFAAQIKTSATVNSKLYIDGGTATIDTLANTEKLEGITLGAWYNGTLNSNCRIAEVAIYDSILSSTDINAVANYMATKYGTVWTDI